MQMGFVKLSEKLFPLLYNNFYTFAKLFNGDNYELPFTVYPSIFRIE